MLSIRTIASSWPEDRRPVTAWHRALRFYQKFGGG
jgi:hypothetical protein